MDAPIDQLIDALMGVSMMPTITGLPLRHGYKLV
jgi:hypothetical protein